MRWTEEPGSLQSVGLQESDMTWQLNNNNISKEMIFLNYVFYICMSSFPTIKKYNMFSENNSKIWYSERDSVS